MKIKIIVSFMITFVLTAINSCGQEHNIAFEKQSENMLLELYTKHFQIWETPSDTQSPEFYEKLDSLMQKYGTTRFLNKAREALENVGADILTMDRVSLELNENLKIEKDSVKENVYIVCFDAKYSDTLGGASKEHVILHVTVVKEGGTYRIDSVEN